MSSDDMFPEKRSAIESTECMEPVQNGVCNGDDHVGKGMTPKHMKECRPSSNPGPASSRYGSISETNILSLFAESSLRNEQVYYRPQKLHNSLLSPFVDFKDPQVQEDISMNQDHYVMEQVRQKLLSFASTATFQRCDLFNDLYMVPFDLSKLDWNISHVKVFIVRLDKQDKTRPMTSHVLELSFRVLSGTIESTAIVSNNNITPKRSKPGEEIHIRPGIEFEMRNISFFAKSYLLLKIRKDPRRM